MKGFERFKHTTSGERQCIYDYVYDAEMCLLIKIIENFSLYLHNQFSNLRGLF